MKASIVVGLGFGDEGKGITTDYLCSHRPNQTLVVRYSGGQQCGHTVVIDGKQHIHANFGSGTLRGVPSYFSEHCSFYMNTLVNEWIHLDKMGVKPELYMNPLTIMTTPYDVAYGRIKEKQNKHGSCGLGIGATMARQNGTHKLYAVDLIHPNLLTQKLQSIDNYYLGLLKGENLALIHRYTEIVNEEFMTFMQNCSVWEKVITLQTDELFQSYNHLVFEGSQGILLDKDHGIFPNVTYANTTSKNAVAMCNKLGLRYPSIYYVTRCYHTRHGNGWMSNQAEIELINNEGETCVNNPWQGEFRMGELDYELLNYSLEVDGAYHNIKDATIVVTCMDQRPDFRFDEQKIDYYTKIIHSYSPDSKDFR